MAKAKKTGDTVTSRLALVMKSGKGNYFIFFSTTIEKSKPDTLDC